MRRGRTARLTRNAARCRACDDVIESKTVHDFRACGCGAIFVDGGLEYVRRGGDPGLMEDLSEFECGEPPFIRVRARYRSRDDPFNRKDCNGRSRA